MSRAADGQTQRTTRVKAPKRKRSLTLREALEHARDRHKAGDLAAAARLCDQVLAVQPDYGSAVHLKGLIVFQQGDKPAGLALLERAAGLQPKELQVKLNLARMLRAESRPEEAIAMLEAAVAQQPDSGETRSMLLELCRSHARRLHNKSRLAASMATIRRALALAPEDAKTHFQLAESLLLSGALARGFEEYEWRWQIDDFPNRFPGLKQPSWDGGPLEGKTILIHPEQGLGDHIQFSRYLPLLAGRGARTVLVAPPALKRLLGSLEGVDWLIGKGGSLPQFDCHVPVMSLPRLFGTTIETIPARIPYLSPDPAAVARWRERLADLSGLRIGFAWAGSTKHPNDKRRSIDPRLLLPLLEVEGTSWVSLQTADRREELAVFEGHGVLDITDELGDFAETTAITANLDLVLCIDTALGHAAGATGTPVWLMLCEPSDWRWLIGGTDTAWYPGHRLFRQPRREHWEPVVETLREALIEAVAARSG